MLLFVTLWVQLRSQSIVDICYNIKIIINPFPVLFRLLFAISIY